MGSQDIEGLNSRLVRKISVLQANRARFAEGLVRFRSQMSRTGPKRFLNKRATTPF